MGETLIPHYIALLLLANTAFETLCHNIHVLAQIQKARPDRSEEVAESPGRFDLEFILIDFRFHMQ